MFKLNNLGITIEAPSGSYTYGRLINSNPPGTGNGSPAIAEWANDPLQGMYAALDHFGLVPTDLQEQKDNSDFVRLLNAVLPVGSIFPVAMTTDPATLNIRALPCDGSAVSEITYAELFAAIGNVWDTGGEPVDTFRVPELRGEFLRGWDNGRGVDPARVFAAAQAEAFKQHRHKLFSPAIGDDNIRGFGVVALPKGVALGGVASNVNVAVLAYDVDQWGNQLVEDSGGTETHPRNQTVRYLIRY